MQGDGLYHSKTQKGAATDVKSTFPNAEGDMLSEMIQTLGIFPSTTSKDLGALYGYGHVSTAQCQLTLPLR